MKKIIIIHPHAGVNWKDNSAIFALELARHLDNHFEVELLSGADCGSFSRPLRSIIRHDLTDGVESFRSTSLWSQCWHHPQIALENLNSFLASVAYLWRNPADLIISLHGYSSLLAASLSREIHGTPVIHIQHQTQELQRILALRPERLICLNPLAADYARRLASQQSVMTIPYGVELEEFSPRGKAITTGLAAPCIIAVASLNRDRALKDTAPHKAYPKGNRALKEDATKGFLKDTATHMPACVEADSSPQVVRDTATHKAYPKGNRPQRLELTIEAVSRLPHASLLICGEGTDREYFQALGDRLLGKERFQIKSFAYAQMPQVYRSADIFTCAASEESGGMKYLEAMACGLPVVATDDAVRRYLIGNAGITCDVTNIECYAKSLQTAGEKYRYQQQPRQNALRFSLQGVSLVYYKAIMQTITDSRRLFVNTT